MKGRYQTIELDYSQADYNEPIYRSERNDDLKKVLPEYHKRKHKIRYGTVYVYDHQDKKTLFQKEVR